jgi:hypothetical protein
MATRKERIEQYQAFISRETASGVEHLGFFCPHCRFELKTQRPTEGDTWDSMTECPSCQGMFFRSATGDRVTVHVPDMAPMTNDELIGHIMGQAHPLYQVFVFAALENYCKAVDSMTEGAMANSGISEKAWREVSKGIGGFIRQRPMVKVRECDED